MRRLGRWGRFLCTLLSAVLLVAASVMWVRSYWRHDAKLSKHGRVQRSVSSVLGGVRYLRAEFAYTVRPEHEDFNWYSREVHPSDAVARAYGSRSRAVELAGFHLDFCSLLIVMPRGRDCPAAVRGASSSISP